MTILDLLTLQNRWKIVGITAHDLFNWHARKIELCYLDERMSNGNIRCWVDCGSPYDSHVSRDTKFGKQVAQLIGRHAGTVSGDSISNADIIDRFITRGVLWLVLRNGKVIDERSIRVKANSCRSCKAVPASERESCLQFRQSGNCRICFARLLPENVQWSYTRSTWESTRVSGGYRIRYDPILGVSTPVHYGSDQSNRDEATRRAKHHEASESNGNLYPVPEDVLPVVHLAEPGNIDSRTQPDS